jgi:hypothetical protein
MTSNQTEPPEVPYFGGCPSCHKTDGYVNIGRVHWFVCDAHRTRWSAGSNLFSCWRDETEEIWQKNHERFGPYREVEPYRETAFARPNLRLLK